jgi:RNA polymerase sigma factor (sigma-70 family)
MTVAVSSRNQDEKRIVELLDTLHVLPAEDPRRTGAEQELFRLVDKHMREVLKPLLLGRFGAAAGESGAARFTAMMSDFFIKVLAGRPDEFWRARSASELRKWTSVVVSNLIRDHLRRENKYNNFDDGFGAFVLERRDFFMAKTSLPLSEKALDLIDKWCNGGEPSGLVLRHRFIDGMTREQIAEHLNVSVHTVRKTLDKAMDKLRLALPND